MQESVEPVSLHKEYSMSNGNEDAVIFVHGILGSPNSFRFLAEYLSRRGFDCIALLLPGHGGTARTFYSTPCAKWPAYIKQRVREAAAKYRRVFLVGHSLGGLISLDCATGGGVAGIILINTPLAVKVSAKQLAFSMKIALSPPGKDDAFLSAYRDAYSISGVRLFEYPLWLGQFIGLYRYIRQARRLLGRVQAKTLIIQASRDETVQLRSTGMLKSGLVNAAPEVIELKDSYHGYFPEQDKERLMNAVESFMASA